MLRLWLLLLCLAPAFAQNADARKARADYVRSNYAKFEYRIPMRDGKRLFTCVYVPNGVNLGTKYPIVLHRTPYSVGPYGQDRYKGELGISEAFDREGFIFAFQDVRGRFMSEGTFEDMRPMSEPINESTDTYDTVDWMVKHVKGNNGKVGMRGTSYPGFYSAAGAVNSHPALKGVSPQAPIADFWRGDDMHRNGAFCPSHCFHFLAFFARPRPEPTDQWGKPFVWNTSDAYQYFLDLIPLAKAAEKLGFPAPYWQEIVDHPNYDEYWQARNLLPHLKGITSKMMIVGGWYDTEDLYGPLHIYETARKLNPTAGIHLVMGPWSHGAWMREATRLGDVEFGFKTGQFYQDLELAWFKETLKGVGESGLPGALVFETGPNRWRSFPSWPPATQPKKLFLGEGHKLKPQAGDGHDDFVSDPNRPVPYTMNFEGIRLNADYMTEDQRFAARRPDVLVWQSEPLAEPLTVAGPIEAELHVSTSGSDADWIVKLIDVNPPKDPNADDHDRSDQQTLVRGEPFRGRFRESLSQPKAFEPNQPTLVKYTLNDCFHTFGRKHRVMIQVQSSWFPFIDRNPQKYLSNMFYAGPGDMTRATHRVFRNSSVTLRVLPNED